MTAFIVVIHVIVCFILILVILLQAGRGSGLSWGVFGGSPQSFLGTKSASFLTKATSVSAILFLLTCITLNLIETRKSRSLFSGKANQLDVNKIKEALDKVNTGETPITAELPKGDATQKQADQASEAKVPEIPPLPAAGGSTPQAPAEEPPKTP